MWRTLPFVLLISSPVYAVPVVPNFQTGSSVSRTETPTIISEQIRTTHYSGFQYSVSGSELKWMETPLLPQLLRVTKI